MIEFQPFDKIARLNRDILVTEKIDGTNAAIGIVAEATGVVGTGDIEGSVCVIGPDAKSKLVGDQESGWFTVYAQSRRRIISPEDDNYGFAKWVWDNAESLVEDLGPGLHFGEWWGSGVNRGYDLPKGEKRFSLFNVKRWNEHLALENHFKTKGLSVVPVLYSGPFDKYVIDSVLEALDGFGSVASPGFNRPEGIVVYHTAARTLFKVTVENDEKPKALAAAEVAGLGGSG